MIFQWVLMESQDGRSNTWGCAALAWQSRYCLQGPGYVHALHGGVTHRLTFLRDKLLCFPLYPAGGHMPDTALLIVDMQCGVVAAEPAAVRLEQVLT